MKQVRVVDDIVYVHSEAGVTSTIVAELHPGDEFGVDIGKTVKVSGVSWCAAKLPDGKVGYVVGTLKVLRIRPVTLAQSSVDVFASPHDGSNLKATYTSGDKFTLAGVVKHGGERWIEIRTESGDVGFVPAGTLTKDIVDPARQAERKDTFANHGLLQDDQASKGNPFGLEDAMPPPPERWWTSKWVEPLFGLVLVLLVMPGLYYIRSKYPAIVSDQEMKFASLIGLLIFIREIRELTRAFRKANFR
jgi:hypothetical protein